jgi:hypothetical protein
MTPDLASKLRTSALVLSALPILLWPFFLIAGAMPPDGGWLKEGLFGIFVYFTMLYPAFVLAARWLSFRLASRSVGSVVVVLTAALPFIVFSILVVATGVITDLLKASGHG